MEMIDVDACIVGAGFAGLAASYKLQKNNQSIAVLEARNRVGGRVYTHHLPDGTVINRGGTWVGRGHERMYSLAQELGVKTYRQYVHGDNLMLMDGKRHRYSGAIPRINPIALADVGLAMAVLNKMAKEVPLDAPWNAKKALEWDSQTIGSWIHSRWNVRTAIAQKMLSNVFIGLFMSDPSEVSLLHALHLIHSLESLEWALSAVGGAQQDLIMGGMQSIADGLVAKLDKTALHFATLVKKISQDKSGVHIIADELIVNARHVIIAIPPILAGRLEYEPLLPALKTQLQDRSIPGQGIKWHAVFPDAFWRAKGFTGQGADMDAPPQECLDCSLPDGKPGILAAFAFGPAARKLATMTPQERQQVLIKGLVKRFGKEAENPIFIDEYDWAADPFAHGDMFAHYAPGVLTSFGKALREPCGRIHWAGTETAIVWSGSIEGAVRSGERAADEVLKLI